MTSRQKKTAVILLAYGGPESLDDIPEYLLDIRGGRHTPQHLVDDITERYRLIGSRSPLLEITQSVAIKLQQQIDLPVYAGMRHWSPFIKDVVAQMSSDGIGHMVAICMAPHYSMLSIGKYKEQLDAAVAGTTGPNGRGMTVEFVKSWHLQPAYLQGIAGNVRAAFSRWPVVERDQVLVIFTAHSLPEFILERGDPYDDQLRETAASLADLLALPEERWTFSYQSAAKTGVPWLGPQIEDLVGQLADLGQKDLLIVPIGFIADHVEILYDVDIGVKNIARENGIRLERTDMLNDGDLLVEALVTLVHDALEPAMASSITREI